MAAMRIPWLSFLAACCCRGSNVQPTARKRKGLAAKQTRFAREEWMLGAAGTEPAAPRPEIEPALPKIPFAGEIFAVLARAVLARIAS